MLEHKRKVLVVDDSAYMRKVITDILQSDRYLEVIGTARNGQEALDKVAELKPDVVTMDVEMPVMDGIESTRRIMAQGPVPVVMLSSLTGAGAKATVEALTAGAVDFIQKPSGAISLDLAVLTAEITRKVKVAAASRPRSAAVVTPPAPVQKPAKPAAPTTAPAQAPVRQAVSSGCVVVIASSTGGPSALVEVFSRLDRLDVPMTIVQHMPSGFTKSLAARLDDCSGMTVREAEGGEKLEPGVAYLAPGGRHMVLGQDGTLKLLDTPPVHGVRPAADPLMDSLVRHAGRRVVGVVLTGMGFDGARGMAAIKKAGGRTIAEDESTCVVYGMPRAVVEMGNADTVVPIQSVAASIQNAVMV